MNDFVIDVLKSILRNVSETSCTKEKLFRNIKSDLDEDIENYEITPILEKSFQLNILKELNGDSLLLTDYGRELMINPDSNINDFWNNQLPKETSEKLQSLEAPFASTHYEALNSLIKAYDEYSIHLRKYLKSLLMNMNPYNFESLVIQVLVQVNEAPYGEVTKKSGDGGIDGLLYRTLLKQGEIPVQIKRYLENNLVGEQDIRDFIGAWSQKHNNGAYFVTTSSYTNKAKLKSEERGIILIDGNQLVDLMINHQIGLKETNDLKFCLTPSLELFD
ncbi:restriction endonuclease [Bacillus safensis]|uniref:restriction endonuclease n=1 Tax=Bacillus safensis TaxID=561879 RepID=UPI001430BA21|nr:restriction endonuclease [Bacillus safensis]NRF06963.1 restriction endonuclease [Bacillus safensis]